MSENWFPKTNSKILERGTHKAILKEVKPGHGKSYDGKTPRPTLTFKFEEPLNGSVINRTVTANTSPKGKCFALVEELAGFIPHEVIGDPDKFKSFIEDLVGKTYEIKVEPSPNGKFNNIIQARPAA